VNTINWALVGTSGYAERECLPAFAGTPTARLAAVVSSTAERAAQFAAAHGDVRGYGDIEDVCKADDIAAGHAEKLPDGAQLLVLGQQVGGPGQENIGSDALGSKRHRGGDREPAPQTDPVAVIDEAGPALVDIDGADAGEITGCQAAVFACQVDHSLEIGDLGPAEIVVDVQGVNGGHVDDVVDIKAAVVLPVPVLVLVIVVDLVDLGLE